MKDNFPKKQILFSLLFFICSLAFAIYFFRITNINKVTLELAEKQWQAEELDRDEIRKLDDSIQIIEKERRLLETHFARSSDVVPFLNSIDVLGSGVGILVEVSSVDILEDYSGLLVEIKASGSFPGLYKFLTLLENSSYELEFTSMELSRESDLGAKDASNKWNVKFNIKLLSFVE